MLTIVWDVDDVLNDLMHRWFHDAWLAEHLDCRLTYAEITSNPPDKALGVPRSEYLDSLDGFRNTERGRNLTPNPQVLDWFREQGSHFRHIALTARPLETAPDVAHWIMRHFGGWIRCFGVVPTRLEKEFPVYDRSKGEYLAWLGRGDVLVDDSTENILEATSLGLKTFQPAQPWNTSALTIPALLLELSQMAGES